MTDRLEQLREKYGKRDGSTYYPEDPPLAEHIVQKRQCWRVRKFWHHLCGAFRILLTGHDPLWGSACACPGFCATTGYCMLATSWCWVYRFAWRDPKET